MSQSLIVTGMVLSTMPIGEFDKRVVLLTRELGEISAFARGARRPRSQLLAATGPMAFGTFELYEGRNSYTLARASIEAYFLEIAEDYDKVCLAAYFLEMAEYYGIENSDESQRLLLLYQTLRALASDKFSPRLLRIIYEIRTMGINGEYPDVFSCAACGRKEGLAYFHMGRRTAHFCVGPLCLSVHPERPHEEALLLSPDGSGGRGGLAAFAGVSGEILGAQLQGGGLSIIPGEGLRCRPPFSAIKGLIFPPKDQ